MLNAQFDIFSAYDCSRNDKDQKRFIAVLDEVKQACLQKAEENPKLHVPDETGIPDPKFYLMIISSFIVHRLENKNTVGIPELLRLEFIAMQKSPLDSQVAAELADRLIPLFQGADNALLATLCPVAANLSRRTKFNQVQLKGLIESLCDAALSDNSKVRNTASKAIYDNDNIHQLCFDRLFEVVEKSPLRALTVLKNIASAAKPGVWTKYAEIILAQCESDNRAVRVKGFELMSYCLHHLPPETVVSMVNKFTEKKPEAPGDVLISMSQLIQSAITMLARESPQLLADNFPNFLHQMLFFLRLKDDEAEKTINQTILYGITALISNAGETREFTRLQGVIAELTNALTVQYMDIWPQVFSILSTLPPQIHENTFELMQAPITAALEKLSTDADSHHKDVVVQFVATCMNEMGIRGFFEATGYPLDNEDAYKNAIIPVLTAYNSRKNGTDLLFTEENFFPFEAHLYEVLSQAESDEERNTPEWVNTNILWNNLWNAIPQCVTSSQGEQMEAVVELCCMRFEEHKELIRPISKIFYNISRFIANMEQPLMLLINASVDSSTSSSTIPAISAICSAKKSDELNSFFTSIAKRCLETASDPNQMNIACALVDVILAMCPYLNDENKDLFYKMMVRFIKKEGNFQKKALRAIRELIKKYKFPGAILELKNVLASTSENQSSSTIRYRILLMTTLLEASTDEYSELLSEFLPEIVAAVKDQGEKTRSAAEEALQTIAGFQAEGMGTVDALIAGICAGLASDSSPFVASSIESIAIVLRRFYGKVSAEVMESACEGVWSAAKATQTSEVARSGLTFCKMLITRVPKYAEAEQLKNIIEFAIMCNKRTNWEIRDNGHHMIERCIEAFGIDPVTEVFPKEELRLLRGARKENSRNTRKKESEEKNGKDDDKDDNDEIEFDDRYNDRELDLLDTSNVIAKKAITHASDDEDENLEVDDKGRIIMKEAPKARKTRQTKEAEDNSEDEGNEVDDLMNKRRSKKLRQRQEQKAKFVEETGNKFRAPRGKGDVMRKGGQVPFAQATLSAKTVNKRLKGQMKAQYKELFKKR
jgi:hypothetical protein